MRERHDLRTTHEEADVIIPQQAMKLVPQNITVICDDTDVFVLLLYYYCVRDLSAAVLMEGTSPQRALENIGETVKKYRDILPNLLAAHALTGCDTVGSYFGIGKATAVKVLESGYQFHEVGDPSSDIKAVNKEATS